MTADRNPSDAERKPFAVALTADFFDSGGRPKYPDVGLSVLDAQPHITQRVLAEHRERIGPDQIAGVQGVIVLTPTVTAETVSQADNLLAIGRFGVGYDGVDVDACTRADVAVLIAAGAVDRSVAEATVGWMIALGHHLRVKDQLVRSGQWDQRSRYMGSELRDRVLGVIGLGGIARATIELLRPFGMQPTRAYDPFADPAAAARLGVQLVALDELLQTADFVSIHCPLNAQTRGLIDQRELALMKPSAYLINTARGGIVEEDALYVALRQEQIAGAAIDCFVNEPLTAPHRFGELENVLLAPHSIAWTHELFRDIGRAACQSMVDLSLGRRPNGIVNPAVLEHAGFQAKWQRLCGARPAHGPAVAARGSA
ncbi:MAG TPA: NAD(P)-dependent oxidoreductase [Pirellulales bacterium]|jgi:phosphoglycerate dehydrogenase-like enzyme|nr:NAD(P)-dependent oxidoreductase [Pirellulales bacterium]